MTFETDDSDNAPMFSWVSTQSNSVACSVEALGLVADRLDANSHPQVISDFCSSVGTFTRFLDPQTRAAIERGYLRFPYFDHIASSYFSGLRVAQIDLRDHVRPLVTIDWSFPRLGNDDATWHYHMYLAALGDGAAHDALAKKIAGTESGNDVVNFLEALAELQTPGAEEILRRYVGDTRTSDAPDGPGEEVGTIARRLLQ